MDAMAMGVNNILSSGKNVFKIGKYSYMKNGNNMTNPGYTSISKSLCMTMQQIDKTTI